MLSILQLHLALQFETFQPGKRGKVSRAEGEEVGSTLNNEFTDGLLNFLFTKHFTHRK